MAWMESTPPAFAIGMNGSGEEEGGFGWRGGAVAIEVIGVTEIGHFGLVLDGLNAHRSVGRGELQLRLLMRWGKLGVDRFVSWRLA